MWNCDIGYITSFGGGVVGVIICGLIIVAILALLYRISRTNNSNASKNLDKKDSLEIIKARYAKGEINVQEYQRMKDVLYM